MIWKRDTIKPPCKLYSEERIYNTYTIIVSFNICVCFIIYSSPNTFRFLRFWSCEILLNYYHFCLKSCRLMTYIFRFFHTSLLIMFFVLKLHWHIFWFNASPPLNLTLASFVQNFQKGFPSECPMSSSV